MILLNSSPGLIHESVVSQGVPGHWSGVASFIRLAVTWLAAGATQPLIFQQANLGLFSQQWRRPGLRTGMSSLLPCFIGQSKSRDWPSFNGREVGFTS